MQSMAAQPENFRYVRVQDDLHGMHADASGNLVLACNPDATRNTMHFAINGVVGDHAYGRFNLHPDGSLKGKVVVIADPEEMGVPAGFNQADTWFRMGATKNDDGTLTRELNAGHATIVVPRGVEVPAGLNAVFYDGTIEGRDAAVAKTLADQQVVQRGIGFRSWTDSNEGDAPTWARDMAAQLYPKSTGDIHIGMHDSSPDDEMDTVGIENRVESFRRDGTATFVNDNGISEDYLGYIESAHKRGRGRIDAFLVGLSEDEFERCGAFYEGLRAKLDSDKKIAQGISTVVAERMQVRRELFGVIEDKLNILAPHGEIYLAKADGSAMEKLAPRDAAYRLMDKEVASTDQVWIQGQAASWQPVLSSPLRDMFFQARGEPVPAAPTFSMPPPLPEQSAAENAQDAMRELSMAIDRGDDSRVLAGMFEKAVKATALGCQESGANASVQTMKTLDQLGGTIKSLAIINGDMQSLEQVDVAMAVGQGLGPKPERAFAEEASFSL